MRFITISAYTTVALVSSATMKALMVMELMMKAPVDQQPLSQSAVRLYHAFHHHQRLHSRYFRDNGDGGEEHDGAGGSIARVD
jgi:hypothetical protein